jgi:hypothetical protein
VRALRKVFNVNLTILPELEALIPPLTARERDDLEASIKANGVLEPIKVWRRDATAPVIVDGHNRYRIATRLGVEPLKVDVLEFPDLDEVKAWMLRHQVARRSLTRDQRAVLFLMHGQPAPADCTRREAETAAEALAHGYGPRVLSGAFTLRMVRNRVHPPEVPRKRAPRAGDAPNIPDGHELGGLSTLVDADGNARQAWHKTRIVGADDPPHEIVPAGHLIKRTSTMVRGDGTTAIQWVSSSADEVAQWESIKAAVVAHCTEHVRALAPVEAPTACDDDLLAAYPIGDPHVGMLAWAAEVGESFDLKIAERELCECMRLLVARAPAAKRAIVCNLGDFWHAENDTQRTPRGNNKLDVDGRSGKVGRVGLAIMQTLVDTALTKHEHVTIRSLPGNHDPNSAFWLPEVMRREYKNEPRVTVEDAFNPYQFDLFGKCLLGWAHGDGAKLADMGGLMATHASDQWSAHPYRYWNVGHVHHWSQKELAGVFVDTHRTLAGKDAWHHHSGYYSGRALKVNVYHRDWGLDAVGVVGVERVRAAIEASTRAA